MLRSWLDSLEAGVNSTKGEVLFLLRPNAYWVNDQMISCYKLQTVCSLQTLGHIFA